MVQPEHPHEEGSNHAQKRYDLLLFIESIIDECVVPKGEQRLMRGMGYINVMISILMFKMHVGNVVGVPKRVFM
jgi:hypothetical protein